MCTQHTLLLLYGWRRDFFLLLFATDFLSALTRVYKSVGQMGLILSLFLYFWSWPKRDRPMVVDHWTCWFNPILVNFLRNAFCRFCSLHQRCLRYDHSKKIVFKGDNKNYIRWRQCLQCTKNENLVPVKQRPLASSSALSLSSRAGVTNWRGWLLSSGKSWCRRKFVLSASFFPSWPAFSPM